MHVYETRADNTARRIDYFFGLGRQLKRNFRDETVFNADVGRVTPLT